MDKKQFEQQLYQLADMDVPQYLETVYDSELDPETGIETVTKREVLVQGQPTLKKLKPCLRNCDYCDKTVTDQIVNIRQAQDPVPHWRWRCTACNCYLHPETRTPMPEDLATSLGKIGRYWKNKLLGLNKWQKPNKAPVKTTKKFKPASMNNSGRMVSMEVEDSDNSTITRYVYDRDK